MWSGQLEKLYQLGKSSTNTTENTSTSGRIQTNNWSPPQGLCNRQKLWIDASTLPTTNTVPHRRPSTPIFVRKIRYVVGQSHMLFRNGEMGANLYCSRGSLLGRVLSSTWSQLHQDAYLHEAWNRLEIMISNWVKCLSDQLKVSKVKHYFGGFYAPKLQTLSILEHHRTRRACIKAGANRVKAKTGF